MQVWATIVFPMPSWHQSTTIQFNTLLRTRDADSNILMLSTLNFATSHTPHVACKATVTTASDATQHVRAELYHGSNLVYEKISGTFSIHNDTALSMAEPSSNSCCDQTTPIKRSGTTGRTRTRCCAWTTCTCQACKDQRGCAHASLSYNAGSWWWQDKIDA
jgi:hypothetical protein